METALHSLRTMLLDGRAIARSIESELTSRVAALRARGVTPSLAVLRFGADGAAQMYARSVAQAASRAGVNFALVDRPASASRDSARAAIEALNADPAVHGILVERPLPGAVGDDSLQAISPEKDVDGCTFLQVGRMATGDPSAFAPCTPLAVIEILRRAGHPPRGKHVVVIGRSATVGRPLSILLARKDALGDATVTLCHSATRDLAAHTRVADVVVAALGRPRFLKPEHVREGAVVIDVGTHVEIDAGGRERVVGDADCDALLAKVAAITPVPGGVGPVTVSVLLGHAVTAAERTLRPRA